jgi:glycosyltransferase involved in cell wall biosynthesis
LKKKILIFIDWYKPGYKAGGPIRSISNIVNQLQDKIDFSIITRNTDYLDSTPYSTIKTNEWNEIDGAKVYYLSNDNTNKATIKKLILEVNPNIVYCNSLYSPKFTLIPIRIAKKLNIKTILAVRGMLSGGSLSVKSHKKNIFLSIIKGIGLFNKTIFHATNSDEQNDILKNFGNTTKVIIAQNLPEQSHLSYNPKEKVVNHLKMVFIGRIAEEKNTLFAIEVLKKCTQNIELDIYGPIYNQDYFEKCKNAINQLPTNIVIKYKGVLNHNLLNETLKNYHVIYLPSTGENFGHSIIEGMCNSCIPIISNKTPWKNLEQKAVGFDIDLNQPNKYTETIDILAKMEQKEFNKISKNAFNYSQNIINDNQLKEDYNKLFNYSI